MFIELEEVRQFASLTDKYLCDREHSYENLMEEILLEHPDPKEALVEFIVDLLLAPTDEVEESIELFLDLPLEQMPNYIVPKPLGQLKKATSLCPPPEEGPYLWQLLLARWRIQLQR